MPTAQFNPIQPAIDMAGTPSNMVRVMAYRFLYAVLLVSALMCRAAADPASDGGDAPTVHETTLARLSAMTRTTRPLVSADRAHVAMVVQADMIHRLLLDGAPIAEAEWIAPVSLRFSPDSRHLLAIAQPGRAGMQILLDGKIVAEHFNIDPDSLVVSADSSALAYAAADTKRHWRAWRQPLATTPKDAAAPFAVASPASAPAPQPHGEPCDKIRALTFVPGTTRLCYIATRSGRDQLINGDIEGVAVDSILSDRPAISADGKRIAYATQRKRADGTTYACIMDGGEGAAFESIEAGSPVLSLDSRRIAYAARRGGKSWLVVDGAEYGPYDSLAQPEFSGDSRHVACIAGRDKAAMLVIDGVVDETYRGTLAGDLTISPDSARFAHVIIDGKKRRVVQGRIADYSTDPTRAATRPALDRGPLFDTVLEGSLRWSPDSSRLAYIGIRDNRAFLVDTGKESDLGDPLDTRPVFSPDGRHLAVIVRHEKTQQIWLDGKTAGSWNTVLAADELSFAGNQLNFMAVEDFNLVRVAVEVGSKQ